MILNSFSKHIIFINLNKQVLTNISFVYILKSKEKNNQECANSNNNKCHCVIPIHSKYNMLTKNAKKKLNKIHIRN